MSPLQARVLWVIAAVVVAVASAVVTLELTDDDSAEGRTATTIPVGASTTTTATAGGGGRCESEEPPAEAGTMAVRVLLPCDGELVAVTRRVPESPGVLRATLVALVAGPTDAESAAGFERAVPEEDAGAAVEVSLAGGVARVGLGAELAEAEVEQLLDTLVANAFQFDTVESVVFVDASGAEVGPIERS